MNADQEVLLVNEPSGYSEQIIDKLGSSPSGQCANDSPQPPPSENEPEEGTLTKRMLTLWASIKSDLHSTFSQIDQDMQTFEDHMPEEEKSKVEVQKLKYVRTWIYVVALFIMGVAVQSLMEYDALTIGTIVKLILSTVIFVLLVLSHVKNLKIIYAAILYTQVYFMVVLMAKSNVFASPTVQSDVIKIFLMVLGIVINQTFISHLFRNCQNKLSYAAFAVTFIGFIHRLVGLEMVCSTKALAYIVPGFITVFLATYLIQKMNNLQREEIKAVDQVINDLKLKQENDRQLTVILESLEEGILLFQKEEVIFNNKISKELLALR